MDNWENRSSQMKCNTCCFFVAKKSENGLNKDIGRCRRNAPTMKGFPVAYDSDWCGEHRIDENKIRFDKDASVSKIANE